MSDDTQGQKNEKNVSLEKAETKLKSADLVSSLADAKLEAAKIQDLLLEKDRRIKELEEAQANEKIN